MPLKEVLILDIQLLAVFFLNLEQDIRTKLQWVGQLKTIYFENVMDHLTKETEQNIGYCIYVFQISLCSKIYNICN